MGLVDINFARTILVKSKLKLSIVLFNNSQAEIELLCRSIEIATQFAIKKVDCTVSFINNGNAIPLPALSIESEIIHGQGNVGFGAAHNLVFKKCFLDEGYDYVLATNPDGAFHQKAILNLFEFANQYSGDLISARQFPEEHPKPYNPVGGESGWVSGACLLHNKTLYEKIGGFDENFFMYMEDVDLSWRTRGAAFKTRVCANALFSHSVLNRDINKHTEKMMFVSGRYLAKKWGSRKLQSFCETELLSRQYFKNKKDLPDFPEKISKEFVKKGIGNFSTQFSFGDPRW